MMRAYHYIYCYLKGFLLAGQQASVLGSTFGERFGTSIKGANLSICFLGFVPPDAPRQTLVRCAEVGALAASFDLLSDGKMFDDLAKSKFRAYYLATLNTEAAAHLDGLVRAKSGKKLGQDGLERGIYAVEIIFAHLRVRDYWDDRIDIKRFGINSQIADDILDYNEDLKSDHLNFLKSPHAGTYLSEYVKWNYEGDMRWSGYPFILRYILRKSHQKALDLLNQISKSQPSHNATAPTMKMSDETI